MPRKCGGGGQPALVHNRGMRGWGHGQHTGWPARNSANFQSFKHFSNGFELIRSKEGLPLLKKSK
jgi:hypothetical protein